MALRLTALGVQVGFTFSLALLAADLASQLASPHRQSIWFGLAGGTAALVLWRMWGWILRRVGISQS
jgi:hypothetical protein